MTGLPLAFGAKVSATVADSNAVDRAPAVRAGFTSPVSDLELEVGGSGFTAGAVVVHNAGTLVANGRPKYLLDSVVKTINLLR